MRKMPKRLIWAQVLLLVIRADREKVVLDEATLTAPLADEESSLETEDVGPYQFENEDADTWYECEEDLWEECEVLNRSAVKTDEQCNTLRRIFSGVSKPSIKTWLQMGADTHMLKLARQLTKDIESSRYGTGYEKKIAFAVEKINIPKSFVSIALKRKDTELIVEIEPESFIMFEVENPSFKVLESLDPIRFEKASGKMEKRRDDKKSIMTIVIPDERKESISVTRNNYQISHLTLTGGASVVDKVTGILANNVGNFLAQWSVMSSITRTMQLVINTLITPPLRNLLASENVVSFNAKIKADFEITEEQVKVEDRGTSLDFEVTFPGLQILMDEIKKVATNTGWSNLVSLSESLSESVRLTDFVGKGFSATQKLVVKSTLGMPWVSLSSNLILGPPKDGSGTDMLAKASASYTMPLFGDVLKASLEAFFDANVNTKLGEAEQLWKECQYATVGNAWLPVVGAQLLQKVDKLFGEKSNDFNVVANLDAEVEANAGEQTVKGKVENVQFSLLVPGNIFTLIPPGVLV